MKIDETTLNEEKQRLEREFTGYAEKIKGVETDLGQMKANLNALNGAIQQTDKFIAMLGQDIDTEMAGKQANVAAATLVK